MRHPPDAALPRRRTGGSDPLGEALDTPAGIAVFIGLTAYDMQKMKADAGTLALAGDTRERWALMWALCFYLDFINLFLLLLRLFGNRR